MDELKKTKGFKKWVAGIFDRASASYDHVGPRLFTYFGDGLVEYAELCAGFRVLDVACGRGANLIPASEMIGVQGEVVGIDISSSMVENLEGDLKQRGISNSTVRVMDAEELRFDNQVFDYVLCGLALFFFPNLNVAMKEFFRVLKPEGIFVASTIASVDTPWSDSLSEIMESYREKLAPAPIAETKDLYQEDEVVEEFEAAGFVEIEHKIDKHQFYFRDESEWWESQWSIFHRGFMERLESDSLEDYKSDLIEIVSKCKTVKGIPTTFSVRYSKAKRPPV